MQERFIYIFVQAFKDLGGGGVRYMKYSLVANPGPQVCNQTIYMRCQRSCEYEGKVTD